MKKTKTYENYPSWIVFISAIFSITTYFIGAFIIYRLGIFWLIIYLAYILWLEIRLLRRSCVNCCYYGKRCAFGKGNLCSLFFRKGDSKKFINDKITFKDIIPDFLVSVVPIIAGIAILVRDFSWLMQALVVILFLLASTGNGFVRGKLACRYCRQREIGCPAERLFSKKK